MEIEIIYLATFGMIFFKGNRPKISPGGMQNEKIENPQTLPDYRSG